MQVNYSNHRLGFYYYPDSLHYRQEDLTKLMPHLKRMGVTWLTLESHPKRAIPEPFIQSLLKNQITPVLHLPVPVQPYNELKNLQVLFNAYASWGVKYLALFDRPNLQSSWTSTAWSQKDLVERFLDCYLPAAESLLQCDLIPVLPPLEPGGDYWDTVFLQSALQGIQRRGYHDLLRELTLAAYGWINGSDLAWGKGGPEAWASSVPYHTPPGGQDQRGFRIFDWYLSISQSVLGVKLPLIMLATGFRTRFQPIPAQPSLNIKELQAKINLELYDAIKTSQEQDGLIPAEVVACNIWLLAASKGQAETEDAWFVEGKPVTHIYEPISVRLAVDTDLIQQEACASQAKKKNIKKTVGHYLLFPVKSWNSKDWLYELIQAFPPSPFVTIGTSISDALSASRVTIFGVQRWLDELIFSDLIEAGCLIEEVYGDGTLIATKINEFVNYREVPK